MFLLLHNMSLSVLCEVWTQQSGKEQPVQ